MPRQTRLDILGKRDQEETGLSAATLGRMNMTGRCSGVTPPYRQG